MQYVYSVMRPDGTLCTDRHGKVSNTEKGAKAVLAHAKKLDAACVRAHGHAPNHLANTDQWRVVKSPLEWRDV